MDDNEGKESTGRRGAGEDRWTWLNRRPRAKGLAARPGMEEDRWTWLGQEASATRRRFRRILTIAGATTGSIAVLGFLLLAIGTGEDRHTEVNALHSPSPKPAAATPPATETLGARFAFAVWDNVGGQWQFDDLRRSGYHGGDAIPFLLRINNARPGQLYDVNIRYDCPTSEASGFDFLTDHNHDVQVEPALAAYGPGRALPDAAVLIPDDASIAVDNTEEGRNLRIWGATFERSPVGPLPPTPCAVDKMILVRVRPRGETVYLAWGGHLASPNESGGQSRAFGMQVGIAGLAQEAERLNVIPAAASLQSRR